jgi:excisionase family DNA binding protein
MRATVGIELPQEVVEQLARRVAELLVEGASGSTPSPWLYGARAAAEYLDWPVGKVEKLQAAGRLPCRRSGRRYIYHRAELDRFVEEALTK